MSEWKYVNKFKGKKIYRRNTNESLEFVIDYLKKQELPYKVCLFSSFIYITNIANIQYLYYWTTGRWCKTTHISLYERQSIVKV